MTTFVVSWVDESTLVAEAKKSGWAEGMDIGPLDYVAIENHEKERSFPSIKAAVNYARHILPADYFGEVRIDEMEKTVEYVQGAPLVDWISLRFALLTKDDPADAFEREDFWSTSP